MAGFPFKNPSKEDYEAVIKQRAKRLIAIREAVAADPNELTKVKAYYKANPIQFIQDWGFTSDPRNADVGLPVLIPFILMPKQIAMLTDILDCWRGRENLLVEKSRDSGASWCACALAVTLWLFNAGVAIGFGSRKEDLVDKSGDPDCLFEKIRTFFAYLPPEFKPKGFDNKVHSKHMTLVNPEMESSITGEAGDNIGRGGRKSLYFVDESAFLERPMLVEASLSATTNCRVDISTPNGEDNPFAQKRHGGRVRVFTFHWKEDPRKDEAWYRKACAKLNNDPVLIGRELDISYTSSGANAFITSELIAVHFMRDSSTVDPNGPKQLSLDVARFGNNESVLTYRQGRLVPWQRTYRKMTLTSLVAEVIMAVNEIGDVEQIATDAIGVGAGVQDMLFDKYGAIAVGVDSSLRLDDGRFYNMRARMWWECREWLKQEVSVPNDPKLKIQLCSPRYHYRGSQLLIESKDDMLKRQIESPDRADSLVLSFAIPVTSGDLDLSFLEEGSWKTS